MSFTDQKRRVATEQETKARWSGAPPGENFRCYLCGHKFKVGDGWRFVFGQKSPNFMVCDSCDGSDVLDRWKEMCRVAKEKYWYFIPNCTRCMNEMARER
jgi:hypothetical protein